MSRSTSMEKHFFLRPALCLHLLIGACFLTLLCFIWNCEGFTQKTKCKYFTAIQINAFSLQALSPPPNIIEVKTYLFGHSQLEKELNFSQFFYRFIYSRKQSNDIVGWLSLGRWIDAVYIDILWWLYEFKVEYIYIYLYLYIYLFRLIFCVGCMCRRLNRARSILHLRGIPGSSAEPWSPAQPASSEGYIG